MIHTMNPFVSELFKKLAKRAGVSVNIEPKWKVVGQIVGKNGKKTYFRNTALDLNTLGATEISADKDYSNYFLKSMGYQTIPGKAFYSDSWAKNIKSRRNIGAAYTYAKKLGFPLMVKPNSKSQGMGVAKVYGRTDFLQNLRAIFKYDRVALVQKIVTGHDYRIVVLDGKIISAYQRLPLSVSGDGKSSIRQLLEIKQKQFIKLRRDTKINFKDTRIAAKLKKQHLSFKFIPVKNQVIYLLDNANLSTGGDAVDITPTLHKTIGQLSIKLARDMGLRFCGVDLMLAETADKPLGKYHVIEINAAPGIDNYFAGGKKQEKIVEQLYLQVLKSMA